MANVGFATLSVIPSFQGFQSRLSAGVAAPMASVGRDGGRRFGDAAGREAGSRFRGGFMERMRGFAPLAGLAAGAGAVTFFKDAIDGASDLQESGTKLEAIFGDAYRQITDYASDAGDALGQTRVQAMDAAATFGTFGKAAGLVGADLANFSTELVSLSTDMASFYNTDVDTAIQAIGSGLRGEAEPLRQFGVLLDDATLRQEALRQGLISTTKDALTPQQKVLAAHAVILEQTTDAQGDFERTSDGLANQQRILTAQWEEMKTAVGSELLPVMTGFVNFLNTSALPALGEVGGLAKSAVSGFAGLPGPVRDAALAMSAFAIASRLGVGPQNAVNGLRTSFQRLRDEVALQRALATGITGGYQRLGDEMVMAGGKVSRLQTATALASRSMFALRGAASGLLSAIGGPWTIGLTGAALLISAFYREHQEAKQRVDELSSSLDQQTGALTENSDEWASRQLLESGALDAARKVGVGLRTVTDAALDDADAMAKVNEAIREYTLENGSADQATVTLRGGIYTLQETVREGRADWQMLAEAQGKSARATDDAASATEDAASVMDEYSSKLDKARGRVRDLMNAEEERASNAVQRRRDQLGLISTLREAQQEARESKRTLDENTKAGQANWETLLEVADQWNNSADKVRNARGAYSDMRQNFIDLAREMGASKERADRLADRFLTMPKPKLRVEDKELDKAIQRARELANLLFTIESTNVRIGGADAAHNRKLLGDSYTGRLNGGPVNAGTPYWVGERGPELVVPKSAGTVLTAKESARVAGGVTVNVGQVVAHDYGDFMRQINDRSRRAASDGIRR